MQYLSSGFLCPYCDREIHVCVGIPSERWLNLLYFQLQQRGTDLRCHYCGNWSHHISADAGLRLDPVQQESIND